MIKAFVVTTILFFSTYVLAESLQLPKVKEGDTWTYRATFDNTSGSNTAGGWSQNSSVNTVTRVTSSTIFLDVHQTESKLPPKEIFVGLDWSLMQDFNGIQTITSQPLNFPLYVGKSWNLNLTNPRQVQNIQSVTNTIKYVIIGYEKVSVPAGDFNALKIEAEGQWTADLIAQKSVVQSGKVDANGSTMVSQTQNNTAKQASGKLYKVYWYAPETKRFVKSVEEVYSNTNVRTNQITLELESFKVN